MTDHLREITDMGFTIIDNIYTKREIDAILNLIKSADRSKDTFRKTNDLFAIRKFLYEVPEAKELIFNDKLKEVIHELFCEDYFIVKSIYFDKPEKSNWFVPWHQDLTIAVDRKANIEGYGPWTVKLDKFAVQPPTRILHENFTIRIHLDDTDEQNGALKVLKGSHHSVLRVENIEWGSKEIYVCDLKAGSIMIMRPLLMHASERTVNNNKRRVIHIEFGKAQLPDNINWAEEELIN